MIERPGDVGGESGAPQTYLEFLKSIADQYRQLHTEARQAILGRGDNVIYRQNLLMSAALIANLPQNLEEIVRLGDEVVSREVLERIRSFALMAEEAMTEGDTFAMGVLLSPRGSKRGDENLLEQLIRSLEPTNETPP